MNMTIRCVIDEAAFRDLVAGKTVKLEGIGSSVPMQARLDVEIICGCKPRATPPSRSASARS
jgi:hypothetical protein